MRYAIGIDIGGTKIAMGVVDELGNVLASQEFKNEVSKDPRDAVKQTSESISCMIDKSRIEGDFLGIGIGAPGPLNPNEGSLICPPNLPKWWDFNIVEEFRCYFSNPIRMENDASVAALAEKWVGAGKDYEQLIYLTISTGIGAGIIINGRLYTGSTGNAGDVGHMVIDASAGICSCGQAGCFEWVASGTALARQGTELLGSPVTPEEVLQLAKNGDRQLQLLIDRLFLYIGSGCVSLINTFDPQLVIIGGGISQIGTPLFKAVNGYVQKYALNPSGRTIQVKPAQLKRNSGIVGAAALFLQNN